MHELHIPLQSQWIHKSDGQKTWIMKYLKTKAGKEERNYILWTGGWKRIVVDYCHLIGLLILFSTTFLYVSCTKPEEELYFTGSSMIEKWDVRKYFPTQITYNCGLSGSGIAYLESQKGMFQNVTVVVISGGNDVSSIDNLDEYADRYVQVLNDLGANHIYLFAILPRLAFEADGYGKVRSLNAKIKDRIGKQPVEVTYIDLFDRMLKDGKLNENYFYDGVHLNSWGYDLISGELNKVLL